MHATREITGVGDGLSSFFTESIDPNQGFVNPTCQSKALACQLEI